MGCLVDRLDLARGSLARRERGDVARKAREVSPPLAGHGRHGADTEAEVVAAQPVAEVVSRAEVAAAGALAVETEVRRLVPAVARRGQRVDDPLEVALHRVGLARELLPVREGEARTRLRLELVAREVLGLEREGLGEVAVEVGGALARNAVDEIERDVVESGIAKSVHGAADVVRRRLSLEHLEQVGLEALRAERDAASRRSRAGARRARGVTVSGFASTVTSAAARKRAQQPRQLARLGERRRPAAEEHRLERRPRAHAPSSSSSARTRIDVRGVLPAPPDDRDEVAVPAAVRAERQVHVQVPDAAHATASAPSRG